MTCPSVPHVSIFISSLSLSLLSKFSKFSSRIYLDNNLLECFKLEGLCWKKSSWVNDPKNEYISEFDLSFSYILLSLQLIDQILPILRKNLKYELLNYLGI